MDDMFVFCHNASCLARPQHAIICRRLHAIKKTDARPLRETSSKPNRQLIAALARAHVQYSTGKAVMPVRLVAPLPPIDGRITSMPGYLNDDKALGMKVVTYFQKNPQQNLPAILATIMLFSAETGKMIAAMDGTYITTIRTACASALATRALANPETPVLGILGAGVQARSHILALSSVRKLQRIKIFSHRAPALVRSRKI
jgi:ornithine cyclodeaminase/alanine dehydrogenase-like protein (mu-crystallin family)